MSIEMSDEIISGFVSGFSKLAGNKIIFVDNSFDFSGNIEEQISSAFPATLSTITDSKKVLGFAQLPSKYKRSQSGICIDGTSKIVTLREGKICGCLIFSGDVKSGIISDDIVISDKLLFATDSISGLGGIGVVIISNIYLNFGENNSFYSLNLDFVGV